jgi:hypothetical protein
VGRGGLGSGRARRRQALDEFVAVAKSLAERLKEVAERGRQKREGKKTGE